MEHTVPVTHDRRLWPFASHGYRRGKELSEMALLLKLNDVCSLTRGAFVSLAGNLWAKTDDRNMLEDIDLTAALLG